MQVRTTRWMLSESLWSTSLGQAPESKSNEKHLEISMENGVGFTDSWCRQQCATVQVQFGILAKMGRKECSLELWQQPLATNQMEKRPLFQKHYLHPFTL